MAETRVRRVVVTTQSFPPAPFQKEVRPGEYLRGDVRSPATRGDSAIVVVHGFKGFKDWGFFPCLCDRLAGAGHTVVSFNVSRNGVGESFEDFTELDRFGANTFTLELDEILGVIEDLHRGELRTAAPRRIGMVGHSRGGGQAVLAAAEDERIVALATWAAVSDFDRWTEEVKTQWRADGRIWIQNARTGQSMPLDVALLEDFEANRDRLDIRAAARRLTVPWLIVHGDSDTSVVPEEGCALAREAQHGRLVEIEQAGHTFEARHPFSGSPPQLEQAIRQTVKHFADYL